MFDVKKLHKRQGINVPISVLPGSFYPETLPLHLPRLDSEPELDSEILPSILRMKPPQRTQTLQLTLNERSCNLLNLRKSQ